MICSRRSVTPRCRRSFSNLACFSSLQTLVLDKNDLEDIKACPTIPTLTTLWFNNNRVSEASMRVGPFCSTDSSVVGFSKALPLSRQFSRLVSRRLTECAAISLTKKTRAMRVTRVSVTPSLKKKRIQFNASPHFPRPIPNLKGG